ncbi:MAG: hypothetical protein JST10_10365 [Bacteroidetes bacterium]|nr:hypothetical protein [Bacteroidota bacterium]
MTKQGKYVKNFQEFEKYLIIKKIITLDSLFRFTGINGVLPKQQKRRLYRIEFIKGKFASITIPVNPVNTKFIETELLPQGIIFKCVCDSTNISISEPKLEDKKFLTYKVIVLPRSNENSDIKIEGFKLYYTNTELVTAKDIQEPCLKAGSKQLYLEENYWDVDKPYPKIDSILVNNELARIKKLNDQDKLSDEEFYLNTLSERELVVKIPILDVSLDTKKSRNLVIFISLCFAAFSLNMFRMARISFKKNKGVEPFFLYNVSKDVRRTMKSIFRIYILNIRIDSFLILLYHFIAFLSPLIIVIITSLPKYQGEGSLDDNGLFLFLVFGALCFVTSFFYNYLLLFSNKRGFNVFKEALINMFNEEPDILLVNLKSTFSPKKWLKRLFSIIDKDIFREAKNPKSPIDELPNQTST